MSPKAARRKVDAASRACRGGHGGVGREVAVELGPGVVDLLRSIKVRALVVDLTLDFELDAVKQAEVFPGVGDLTLGFQCQRVNGIDVWWRQRLSLGVDTPKATTEIRPRRLVVGRAGRVLVARADYA